jgi:predicted nucleic acid-binding protein
MILVDANIFLRFLTRDDEEKAAACRVLFHRLERGEQEATTTEVILHEVLYVLSSRAHYNLSHDEAAERLRPLLSVRGLRMPHKRRYLRALDLYGTYRRLDFADAVSIAYMEEAGIAEIATYDTDFDGIPGIRRIEPQ